MGYGNVGKHLPLPIQLPPPKGRTKSQTPCRLKPFPKSKKQSRKQANRSKQSHSALTIQLATTNRSKAKGNTL